MRKEKTPRSASRKDLSGEAKSPDDRLKHSFLLQKLCDRFSPSGRRRSLSPKLRILLLLIILLIPALVLFYSIMSFQNVAELLGSSLPAQLLVSVASQDLGVASQNSPDSKQRTGKYTGQVVQEGIFHVEGRPIRRRRQRRSASPEARLVSQGLRGVARECGAACKIRIRGSDESLYKVHLHRMHIYEDRNHRATAHFVPLVQFLESENSTSARGGRVPFECLYEARVEDVKEHSVINLCDEDRGVFGLLVLKHGTYSIEPIKREANSTGKLREHSVQPAPRHLFASSKMRFDDMTESSEEEDEWSDEALGYNYTRTSWEDHRVRPERSRRAANSWDYHVEVLVVADIEMYRYHGRHLETYLLTLFSTVASIYRHESLRAAVNVVVVKIMVLQHEQSGLRVSANAQETLKQFCRWQQLYSGRGEEDHTRHDVAILLTRGDICRSPGKCDTLGLAELGTMCDREKSCAIIEDNGLSAAFTIAHELGHIFNVPHDDERKCAQFMSLNKANFHIMAPTLEYNTHPWSWSPCSSSLLERFLDNNRGQIQCLFDKPYARHYYDELFEGEPPGRKYDVDQQCKFVFGGDAVICPYMPACRRLWCSVSYGNQQGCRTQHMPWADGTPCQSSKHGGQQFCHRGECVGMTAEYSARQDGGWGEWQPWGRCSRTCGGGIQKASRDCNSPIPANGGKYCTGLREKYRSCAVQECPWDTPPFRDVQCAEFNGKDTGIYGLAGPVTWVSKYGVAENERCKLYCKVDSSAAFHLLKEKVTDGTPCDQYGHDLCVDGTCIPAGCDRVLHSKTQRDSCGVCGGDGSTCEVVRGTFNEQGSFGYNEVMKIPAGSANIDIRQNGYHGQKDDDNYLALRAVDGTFLLNGHYQVSVYRIQIPLQDSIIEYSGSDHVVERVNATGPLRSDVYLHVLSVGSLHPPDIRYEYMLPNRRSQQSRETYIWRMEEKWSDCSAPCQGRQTQLLMCVDSQQRQTAERNCPSRRPTPNARMCNIDCNLRWMTEELSKCSATCGAGTVHLRVFCAKVDSSGRATPLSSPPASDNHAPALCPGKEPSSTRSCYVDCSGRRWAYTEWSGCSQTCGEQGIMRRTIRCMDDANRVIDDAFCARESRQETERECNRSPCPRWSYGAWSECSRSCDGGVKIRHAQCVDAADRELDSSYCSTAKKLDREQCNEHMCTWWQFSAWSACSVTCGTGVNTRQATCTSRASDTLDNDRCDMRERIVQKPCERPECPSWKTSEWSACSLSCGEGWQTRRVTCTDASGESLEPEKCGPRLSSHQMCNHGPCPFWRIGDWSACSVSCGDSGVRTRVVECIHRDQTVDYSFCGEGAMEREQRCSLLPCSSWSTSEWSSCSVSCGVGAQERRVYCSRGKERKIVDDTECDRTTRPRSFKKCERDCPKSLAMSDVQSDKPTSLSWTTAPWGGCSATCGEGTERRLVVCRERGEDVDPQRCAHLERVEAVRRCHLGPCTEWRVEEWQPCPATCGVSIEQTRLVNCHSTSAPYSKFNDTLCEVDTRPETKRSCQLSACPDTVPAIRKQGEWIVRPWNECTVSCGGGWKSREVYCEQLPCRGSKPKVFEVCNNAACSKKRSEWKIAPWTTCSVTCGSGEQRRRIWCENVQRREMVDDAECKSPKPVEHRDCLLASCPIAHVDISSISSSAFSPTPISLNVSARFDWSTGPWSACSANCGKGTRHRVVSCIEPDSSKVVESSRCSLHSKPIQSTSCRTRCARWKTHPWRECSVTCGTGIHQRTVVCQRGRGRSVTDDSDCSHLPKPAKEAKCHVTPCPAYKWQTTPWSLCTDPCSGAEQTRRVYCMSSLNRRAAVRMCAHDPQPIVKRACTLQRCPYQWVPTPWKTCSKSCGNGTQTRSVECRVKTSTITRDASKSIGAVYTAVAVPREKCEALPRPLVARPCMVVSCEAPFIWQTSAWQPCSVTCGPGVRRRRVRCEDASGKRVHREKCALLAARPARTQSCFLKNCMPSTCQEMRDSKNSTAKLKDGNYTLLLDGFPIEVYCARMNEIIPRSYLNVNRATNFAEVYGKRLIFPHTCPHEGIRNDSCLCSDHGDSNAGKTFFRKVRVDLLNRKIKINDFSFAETVVGISVPYATAGDCYSMKDCPQGQFSVDLRGTGVRIVDDLQWEDSGHRTSSHIDRSHHNMLIEGSCGGYCGKCAPDKYKGLVFEIERTRLRD